MSPDRDPDPSELPTEELPPTFAGPARPALIRRRWSVFGRAGGGVVILATVGAIALGTPDPANDDQSAGSGVESSEIAADAEGGDRAQS